jgi:hypothetical protein
MWGIPPRPSEKHQHASACSVRAERRKQNFLFLLGKKLVAPKKKIVKKFLLEA